MTTTCTAMILGLANARSGGLTLGFIQNIGPMEWGIILIVALLLFGRRLPEVGRSIGKGIVEFKKGLKDVGEEIETESTKPARSEPAYRAPLTDGTDGRVARGTEIPVQSAHPNMPAGETRTN